MWKRPVVPSYEGVAGCTSHSRPSISMVHVFTSDRSTVRWWCPLESVVVVVVVTWVVSPVVFTLVFVFSSPAGGTPWAQDVPARARSPPSIQVVNVRLIGTSSFSLAFFLLYPEV